MQLARFLVEAVVLGRQSPNQLVREHPISRSWFYELLARYRRDGPTALEPRSHRPAACPHQVDQVIIEAILELRAELSATGLDAGPQTILHHLAGRFEKIPSRVTVWRILKRQGLITPEPHKRPKASYVRFEAQLPNELWQTDATEWLLADSSKFEILNLIDDHSRLCLASVAVRTVKAADAVQTCLISRAMSRPELATTRPPMRWLLSPKRLAATDGPSERYRPPSAQLAMMIGTMA